MAGSMPSAPPTPINATPTVPAVVHELPVASETTQHTMHAVTRNTAGEIDSRPHTIISGTTPD